MAVVENAQRGKNVGFYSVPAVPSKTENCREYPLRSFHPYLELTDFYVEVWVYVPKTTIRDWINFITVAFPNDGVITVNIWDSQRWRAGQALYLYSANLFGPSPEALFQPNNKRAVTVSFDKWVKIGLEVHFRGLGQKSTLIVYQDDIAVLTWEPTLIIPPPPISSMHFGLYVGGKQTPFSIYNSDIVLYNLSSDSEM